MTHSSEHCSGGRSCFAWCSLQCFESLLGLGFETYRFWRDIYVSHCSGPQLDCLPKILILMQDLPIGEEKEKAEKQYYQNNKWTICTSPPIPSPDPEFMTLQYFVNEGPFPSLLPTHYHRVIQNILTWCLIPIYLLVQVWKNSYYVEGFWPKVCLDYTECNMLLTGWHY